jgi:hypothetical protein
MKLGQKHSKKEERLREKKSKNVKIEIESKTNFMIFMLSQNYFITKKRQKKSEACFKV